MVRLGYSPAVVAALAGLTVAAPTPLSRRAVSADVLQQLTLFAEYSAASYCTPNINSPGSKLTCATGNCPTVQAADTTTLAEFYAENEYGDVAGYLATDATNELIVVAFRGSRTIDTWIANLDFGKDPIDNICSGCEVHGGFWRSWEVVADSLRSGLDSALATYPGYTVVFTGHSFGGAIATLGAAQLRNEGYAIELYPYGSPRVGNEELVTHITNQGSTYRVTHTNDIVPRLPPMLFGFSHTSPEYWITSDNGVTPTTSDVQVIEGIGSREGNAGEAIQLSESHSWYLIDISACQ
ncbi:Alpha/Beta hydrolase protein [Aspergillus karnatakaensis]|uniref:lipase family protein n=1 Tax=Aspergillus karnatakaensis TaxID=1810916 RepID=UPI003CCCB142